MSGLTNDSLMPHVVYKPSRAAEVARDAAEYRHGSEPYGPPTKPAVDPPGVTVVVRQRSFKVSYKPFSKRHRIAVRQAISSVSAASLDRLGLYLENTSVDYTVFGTLTYGKAFPTDGVAVKLHLKALRSRLERGGWFSMLPPDRDYIGRDRSTSWCWYLEFQERGAPHVHFLATHFVDKLWLAEAWAGIIGGGLEAIRAGTQVDRLRGNAYQYARKYTTKKKQKSCPENFLNLGRTWGVWGAHQCPQWSAYTNVATANVIRASIVGQHLGGTLVQYDMGWKWRGDKANVGFLWKQVRGVLQGGSDRDGTLTGSLLQESPLRRSDVRVMDVSVPSSARGEWFPAKE